MEDVANGVCGRGCGGGGSRVVFFVVGHVLQPGEELQTVTDTVEAAAV